MLKNPLAAHAISFGIALLAAIAAYAFAPPWVQAAARVVAAYDAFAITLLAWMWFVAVQRDAERAGRRAAKDDPGRNVVILITIASVVFGFVAALEILGKGPLDANHEHVAFIYAIGLGAVVLGWLVIHTTFLFRYARLYYEDRDRDKQPDAGLIFPGGGEPNDLDFAYFSFVIGMTFQVSDVQICSTVIRRVVLAHGMLSFAYNTAVLALVVNVLSGLLHS